MPHRDTSVDMWGTVGFCGVHTVGYFGVLHGTAGYYMELMVTAGYNWVLGVLGVLGSNIGDNGWYCGGAL